MSISPVAKEDLTPSCLPSARVPSQACQRAFHTCSCPLSCLLTLAHSRWTPDPKPAFSALPLLGSPVASILLNPAATTKHLSDLPPESLIGRLPSCSFFGPSFLLTSGTPFYWLAFFLCFLCGLFHVPSSDCQMPEVFAALCYILVFLSIFSV